MTRLKEIILKWLSVFVRHNPKKIVAFSVILALLSGFYTVRFLKFDTDQDNLISGKQAYHQRYKKFLAEFGDLEYIYVIFDASEEGMKETKKALHDLTGRLQGRNDLYTQIQFKEDFSSLQNQAFLLISPEEFAPLSQKLDLWSSDIIRISWADDYADLLAFAAEKLQMPTETLKGQANELTASFDFLDRMLEGMDKPEVAKTVSAATYFNPLLGLTYTQDPEGYFVSPDGKFLFLQILPVKDYTTSKVIEAPLNHLRSRLDEVRKKYPKIEMGATGRPVLQADEMDSTGTDSVWAGLASFLGVSLLYFLYFRGFKRPVMGISSLLCGMAWAIGFVTLTVGHLNLLTLVFAIILIGLGIDYGIHFILRYQKYRHDGLSADLSIHETIMGAAGAIVTGALSSAASFFSALYADFLGLQELGFVAGWGILFCLFSQIVTLPALLLLFDKTIKRPKRLVVADFSGLDRLLTHPKTLLFILLALTAAGIPFIRQVQFENNLLKLQDPTLESVKLEKKIMENSQLSTWVAAYITPSLDQLKQWQVQVDKLPSVSAYDSILSFLHPDQEERILKLQEAKTVLRVDFKQPASSVNSQELHNSLYLLKQGLERVQALAFSAGETAAVEKIDALLDKTERLREKVEKGDSATLNDIARSQGYFIGNVQDTLRLLINNLSPTPITIERLPTAIQKRYQSTQGNYVLYVYPKGNIWEPETMEQFIRELRSVDPQVTGSPIQVYESAKRMKEGFYWVSLISFIFVIIVLLLDFGSIPHALLALIPLSMGMVWLLSLMGIFHIQLSLANFFALPVLLGIGIDNGVHLVHRYRETYSIRDMLHTVTPAILLSTLTTVIGFGSLAFVRHRGLASFGQIMTLGSITCLLAALLLVPVILKLMQRKQKNHS